MENDISGLNEPQGFYGEQIGIAGAGADQVSLAMGCVLPKATAGSSTALCPLRSASLRRTALFFALSGADSAREARASCRVEQEGESQI